MHRFADERKVGLLIEHLTKSLYQREDLHDTWMCFTDLITAFDACDKMVKFNASLLSTIQPGETWRLCALDFWSEGFWFDPIMPGLTTVRIQDVSTPEKLVEETLKYLEMVRPESDEIVECATLECEGRYHDDYPLPMYAKMKDLVFIYMYAKMKDGEVGSTKTCIGIKYIRDLVLWGQLFDSNMNKHEDGLGIFHYNDAWTVLDFDFTLKVS